MTTGHPYTVLIVEDQPDVYLRSAEEEFAADRAKGGPDEPCLELVETAATYDEAIQFLKLGQDLPDVIVLDDYLNIGTAPQSRAIEIMRWLFEHCESEGIPQEQRPRAVLWSGDNDSNLTYTFCVLGGLQLADKKRDLDGAKVPIGAIWAALAGHRWRPDPYPSGFATAARRAPLPWLEAGVPQQKITELPLSEIGEKVSMDTIKYGLLDIRKMPETPDPPDPGYPENWTMGIRAAKANGWVWVPLDRHKQIPGNAPLPLVIDPDLHEQDTEPYGPLPARVE
jgi:hypothetical protein